jgi:homoserine dehydrogenase
MLVGTSLVPAFDSAPAATGEGGIARLALLGSGTVGQAVLRRFETMQAWPGGSNFRLVYAANTRLSLADPDGLCPKASRERLVDAPRVAGCPANVLDALGPSGIRILIDATADAGVAASHRTHLEAGVSVATACKLAAGTSLERWRSIEHACVVSGARFGDRATVGAGLPLLRSIRELRAGGDRIHAIAGVMSGSLAWLFDRFDGTRPFSQLVKEARAAGYTEPDPREDLSGEDVRRKLLILARAAGFAIDSGEVAVESLVPDILASAPLASVEPLLAELDAPLAAKLGAARAQGCTLRFVARLDAAGARVGLETLCPSDPLASGGGTDNRVAIWSDRYASQPLIIQGPGAGPEVTAAALIDDVLALRAAAVAARV